MIPSIRNLINLVESILLENLSKGSQTVMKNADTVAGLAKRVRRDSRMNPQNFPAGSSANFEKMDDKSVAEWFLGQLDEIEKRGYEGQAYSKDGEHTPWIVAKYILGAHNWEDITGTMGMTLSKYDFLKKRNMLDAAHKNVQSFKSLRELGEYLVYHYDEALKDYNEKMKAAAMKKSVRAFLLVDNDDYKIYTTLNRAANVLMGQGTTWCTSSSSYAGHFHSYSKAGMLFQMFPYESPEVAIQRGDGRLISGKERFQFDVGAGTPNFMNIADLPPNKEYIRTTYPYLYDDLVKGLRSKKTEIEEYIKKAAEDPTLQTDDAKIKEYDVEEEINKLYKFITAGWMVDQPRPRNRAVAADEPPAELPPPEPAA